MEWLFPKTTQMYLWQHLRRAVVSPPYGPYGVLRAADCRPYEKHRIRRDRRPRRSAGERRSPLRVIFASCAHRAGR